MPLYPLTKTANDVAVEVKRAFGDESGVQLTDQDLIRWINAGQIEIVTKNKILKAVAQTDLTADVASYDFPSIDVIEVESLHVDGSPIPPMTFVEAEEYILKYDKARTDVGSPRIWYSYGGKIFLWPKPTTTVTNGIALYYTPSPVPITTLSAFLSLPDKYFNTLVQYVLYKAFEMDENFDASNFKMQEVVSNLTEFAEDEARVYNRTYATITTVEDTF